MCYSNFSFRWNSYPLTDADLQRLDAYARGRGGSAEELGTDIIPKVIPEGGRVRRVVFCLCSLESESLGNAGTVTGRESFSARVLTAMAGEHRYTDAIAAPARDVFVDGLGHKLFYRSSERGSPKDSKPPQTRYEFRLDSRGRVHYIAKELRLELQEALPGKTASDFWLNSVNPQPERFAERLAEQLNDRGNIVSADTNALLLGMTGQTTGQRLSVLPLYQKTEEHYRGLKRHSPWQAGLKPWTDG